MIRDQADLFNVEEAVGHVVRRSPWPRAFPKIFTHTTGAVFAHDAEFRKAKQGNRTSAKLVVERCIDSERMLRLKLKFPNASLLPVLTEGKFMNVLPLMLARRMAAFGNWKVCTTVRKAHGPAHGRTKLRDRFFARCGFEGILQPEAEYIVVDDFVTSGGTVADLIAHVRAMNAGVVAVVTLAASFSPQNGSSAQLAILPETVRLLETKFGRSACQRTLRPLGLSTRSLTNVEGRWLTSFRDLGGAFETHLARAVTSDSTVRVR